MGKIIFKRGYPPPPIFFGRGVPPPKKKKSQEGNIWSKFVRGRGIKRGTPPPQKKWMGGILKKTIYIFKAADVLKAKLPSRGGAGGVKRGTLQEVL